MARVTLNFRGRGSEEYEVSHGEALRIRDAWEDKHGDAYIRVYENLSTFTSHPRDKIESITFVGRGI